MRKLVHRTVFLAALLMLLQTVRAQDRVLSVDAGINVVVTEHPLTADMVEITALDPNYPPDLLRQQIDTLGQLLKSTPRGLTVGYAEIDPTNPALRFLKARFAVDGLIERSVGELRIEPILKAFAGAPAPYTLKGITILFDGEAPNENTVKRYDLPDAFLSQAIIVPSPSQEGAPGIEYSVKYLTQDPNKITYPNRRVEPKSSDTPSEPAGLLPTYVWIAIFMAGLSAGALVYLALAKRPSVRR
ncbi:MAG: hypothetical protein KF784_07985 [Fimbriimonadaceae bacterium]|nr:hypothetical protein [Fimbriimonadaceae bacterium]